MATLLDSNSNSSHRRRHLHSSSNLTRLPGQHSSRAGYFGSERCRRGDRGSDYHTACKHRRLGSLIGRTGRAGAQLARPSTVGECMTARRAWGHGCTESERDEHNGCCTTNLLSPTTSALAPSIRGSRGCCPWRIALRSHQRRSHRLVRPAGRAVERASAGRLTLQHQCFLRSSTALVSVRSRTVCRVHHRSLRSLGPAGISHWLVACPWACEDHLGTGGMLDTVVSDDSPLAQRPDGDGGCFGIVAWAEGGQRIWC